MTIRERISNIAKKLNVPYSAIKLLIYSHYGNDTTNEMDKLNKIEKLYGIQ